ncbi:MAG TPA: SUMF1/EgtB/PvdO family nonheme iron enzyme [Salinivirga sp.]|uniref:SUMF1/EgtB/PvdO family nonheme iron enzyme n=1 Tax=Salinivirga sp. TaxID=1970192 RepID=UPI002B47EF85|nr:SUMF1/EgtB/PvdO family nonheme iron enzyme [Salinivirga sp.]HKK57884.1 SUMF1/EgtB/PvdO family nonheme iron enzyme [Salinivirga sp.]
MKIRAFNLLLIAALFALASCSKETSSVTGWEYNNPDNGGFQYYGDYYEQETGPGLVLIEGGTYIMGRTDQDVMHEWDNFPRQVTVSSFYMDETEVTNTAYREFLYWLNRVFVSYPDVHKNALPDTLVWRRPLAYNEPYVEYYFRHPAYQSYPVVGVNWLQASDFCEWRTDRVNEKILIDYGVLLQDPNQQDEANFNTEAYLAGQYEGAVDEPLPDLDPNKDTRKVRMEDGIFLPKYRLPTEAEWEYAALALIGETTGERVYERRIYPWGGDRLRKEDRSEQGEMRANAVRGAGDMMGVAGDLNDRADITHNVYSYWPNDFGLYNMAGNVNEWVLDVYRPMNFVDFNEFRPFRGNVFKTQVRDAEGKIARKDSLGRIQYRPVTDEEAYGRRNYRQADNINYMDGDLASSIYYNEEDAARGEGSQRMYYTGKDLQDPNAASLINDHTRVYKGGGWRDRIYWLSPGTRRYLQEDDARDDLGFRCAMTRLGEPAAY